MLLLELLDYFALKQSFGDSSTYYKIQAKSFDAINVLSVLHDDSQDGPDSLRRLVKQKKSTSRLALLEQLNNDIEKYEQKTKGFEVLEQLEEYSRQPDQQCITTQEHQAENRPNLIHQESRDEEIYDRCVSQRDEKYYWDPEGLQYARYEFMLMNKEVIKEKLEKNRIIKLQEYNNSLKNLDEEARKKKQKTINKPKYVLAEVLGDFDKDDQGSFILLSDPQDPNSLFDRKGRKVNIRGYLVDSQGNIITSDQNLVAESHQLDSDEDIPIGLFKELFVPSFTKQPKKKKSTSRYSQQSRLSQRSKRSMGVGGSTSQLSRYPQVDQEIDARSQLQVNQQRSVGLDPKSSQATIERYQSTKGQVKSDQEQEEKVDRSFQMLIQMDGPVSSVNKKKKQTTAKYKSMSLPKTMLSFQSKRLSSAGSQSRPQPSIPLPQDGYLSPVSNSSGGKQSTKRRGRAVGKRQAHQDSNQIFGKGTNLHGEDDDDVIIDRVTVPRQAKPPLESMTTHQSQKTVKKHHHLSDYEENNNISQINLHIPVSNQLEGIRMSRKVRKNETISFGGSGVCPWNLIDFKDVKRKIPQGLDPIERKLQKLLIQEREQLNSIKDEKQRLNINNLNSTQTLLVGDAFHNKNTLNISGLMIVKDKNNKLVSQMSQTTLKPRFYPSIKSPTVSSSSIYQPQSYSRFNLRNKSPSTMALETAYNSVKPSIPRAESKPRQRTAKLKPNYLNEDNSKFKVVKDIYSQNVRSNTSFGIQAKPMINGLQVKNYIEDSSMQNKQTDHYKELQKIFSADFN